MPLPYFGGPPIGPSVLALLVVDAAALRLVVSNLFIEHQKALIAGVTEYGWAAASVAADDGVKVIKPADIGGGSPGRWLLLNGLGAALGNADVHITFGEGRIRQLPAATLGANHTCTIDTTGAGVGSRVRVTCDDATAWTYAFINGGPAAGTMDTKPAWEHWWFDFYFDGTNVIREAAGQMP